MPQLLTIVFVINVMLKDRLTLLAIVIVVVVVAVIAVVDVPVHALVQGGRKKWKNISMKR